MTLIHSLAAICEMLRTQTSSNVVLGYPDPQAPGALCLALEGRATCRPAAPIRGREITGPGCPPGCGPGCSHSCVGTPVIHRRRSLDVGSGEKRHPGHAHTYLRRRSGESAVQRAGKPNASRSVPLNIIACHGMSQRHPQAVGQINVMLAKSGLASIRNSICLH